MIHLIVGNTGAGKTTYANRLKTPYKGVVFSIDRWNNTLFLPDKTDADGLQWFLERIERAESVILDLVSQLENLHTDTILDLGYSKFSHREKFRQFAQAHTLEIKLHYLKVSKDIRWKRVQQRNQEKGATFQFEVTREDFDFMETWFEAPTKEEMEHGIVVFD